MAKAGSRRRSPGLADHVSRMRSVGTARPRLLGASVDRTGVALVAALIALAGLGWMITTQGLQTSSGWRSDGKGTPAP
jgi:hypothetical protein